MYRGFLREGVLLAPSRYEAWFVTMAHTFADIDHTVAKAERVWPAVRRALASS
jgi:glutamate-1-semialdehyde 2,1-aminomutase